MENHTKNTPTNGNPLYTEAEQRAMLAVIRDALALSTESIMVWVSIAPHVRGDKYGLTDSLVRFYVSFGVVPYVLEGAA